MSKLNLCFSQVYLVCCRRYKHSKSIIESYRILSGEISFLSICWTLPFLGAKLVGPDLVLDLMWQSQYKNHRQLFQRSDISGNSPSGLDVYYWVNHGLPGYHIDVNKLAMWVYLICISYAWNYGKIRLPQGSATPPWFRQQTLSSGGARKIWNQANHRELSWILTSYTELSKYTQWISGCFLNVMYIYFDSLSKNPWGARAIIDIRQGVCALQIRAAIMARGLKLTVVAHWDTDGWLVIALAFFLAWTSPIQVSEETQPDPRLVQKCTRKQSEQLNKYWRRAQRFPAVLSSCANKDDQNYGFC